MESLGIIIDETAYHTTFTPFDEAMADQTAAAIVRALNTLRDGVVPETSERQELANSNPTSVTTPDETVAMQNRGIGGNAACSTARRSMNTSKRGGSCRNPSTPNGRGTFHER